MDKPVIFFSHSSKDGKIMQKMKEIIIEKTGGSIYIFLSSDGQSIQLGKNWVYRIEEALNDAVIMFVFVTPNSFYSNWIYFEAGFAYSKNINVVPVGFLGVDLNMINPPLNLLQGFNCNSVEGFNNIIHLINVKLSHTHKNFITEEEYNKLFIGASQTLLKEYGNFIDVINITFDTSEENYKSILKEIFKKHDFELQFNDFQLISHGVSINYFNSKQLNIDLDPLIIETTLPILEDIIKSFNDIKYPDLRFKIYFNYRFNCIKQEYKISSRLFKTKIKLSKENFYIFDTIEFKIVPLSSRPYHQKNDVSFYIEINYSNKTFSLKALYKIIDILFENEIIYTDEHDQYIYY